MTMRKKLFFILLLLPIVATAQVKFGYIAYKSVCVEMPQYVEAQRQLADLKKKFEAEAQHGETEFQRKFSEFLQGQKDFPANILQKRQAELQDLMERSVAFREEAQQLLRDSEQKMLQDVYKKLNDVIAEVALERGYFFVLNTDDNAAPFINTVVGEDATDFVRFKLGIITELPVRATDRILNEVHAEDATPSENTTPTEESAPTEE